MSLRRVLLPRQLHPFAWWLWALGLAAAAGRTTNVLLLALLAAVAGYVVSARRTEAPWARAYGVFLRLGITVVLIRVVFQSLLVGSGGTTVLLDLPEIPLPGWMAGVRLGGPVTAEAAYAALDDGARLAAMLLCFGAANALASPARLLRALPRALHELGVAVTVALSAAPQLVTAVARVRRARRLRALPVKGLRGTLSIVVPVLEEALDRSLTTAAALDARGYGRRAVLPAGRRTTVHLLTLGGLLGVVVGLYAVFDSSTVIPVGPLGEVTTGSAGPVLLAVGLAGCLAGLRLGGTAVRHTRYRPDPWVLPEWIAAGSGVGAAVCFVLAGGPDSGLAPDPWSLQLPGLPPLAVAGLVLALLPAHLTPPPPAAAYGSAPVASAAGSPSSGKPLRDVRPSGADPEPVDPALNDPVRKRP
ncbi:energy-coupling factor transporter transmembrane protein EcfT [Kitasatospora sp. NPDC093679]|uniref:energy-coupling factor transporter transmembrane protein EcfT n=1 Tax=Kitasatospora sp. NPDC093679 TaxID=3154983 RepID=UPI00342393F4